MLRTVQDLYDQWRYGYRSYKGKMEIVFGGYSMGYLARNHRMFQGESKEATFIMDLIVSKTTLWAARCKEFYRYDAESIMRSWHAVLGVGGIFYRHSVPFYIC